MSKRECVKVYLTEQEASELRTRAGYESLSAYIRRQVVGRGDRPAELMPIKRQVPAERSPIEDRTSRPTHHPRCPCEECRPPKR